MAREDAAVGNTDGHETGGDFDRLRELGRLREEPFRSSVPVFGGLIAAFRTAWNSVSTKWYVRPMMAQQTAFNEAVVDSLESVQASVADAHGALDALQEELDRRLLAQDRDHVRLTHDLGEATAALAQVNRALDALEDRLARLEERSS
jgi:septal ring factor EnvC (AmiA/AmiB activator)